VHLNITTSRTLLKLVLILPLFYKLLDLELH